MDLLPSLLALVGATGRLDGRVLDGKSSLAAIILDNSTATHRQGNVHPRAKSAHSFLPFYNNPYLTPENKSLYRRILKMSDLTVNLPLF